MHSEPSRVYYPVAGEIIEISVDGNAVSVPKGELIHLAVERYVEKYKVGRDIDSSLLFISPLVSLFICINKKDWAVFLPGSEIVFTTEPGKVSITCTKEQFRALY